MSSTGYADVVAALLRTGPAPGAVVRTARTALRWSQAELGRRCGYSASQVSRWETGRLPLHDVPLLRTLASVLALPPAVFGLEDTSGRASRPAAGAGPRVCRVPPPFVEEADPVHRRAFLHLVGITAGTLAWPDDTGTVAGTDPARALTDRLGSVLLGPARSGEPAPADLLTKALAAARQEFAGCRYLPLASRLPALIVAAEATAATGPGPQVHGVLADSYCLAARALMKLDATGLEWVAADRAMHAAEACADPLGRAEAQRLVASVARRAGHHDRARALTLDAVSNLDVTGRHPEPEHLAMHATLHLTAAYAAARAGDRERAGDLLTEAATTIDRLTDDPDRHRYLIANLISHKVSAAYLLGDAGAALAHSRSLPLAAIPTTERRARLLVDTAQAWARWDKPERAYGTLLAAERTAPGEVRTRSAVRHLVTDLMSAPRQSAMPGLPALALRVRAVGRPAGPFTSAW